MAEYDDDIRIEPLSLDLEWLDQARRYRKYSDMLADKNKEVDRAELDVDVEKAEADKRARQRHAADAKAPTEAVIKAEVLTDPALKRAHERYLDLKHDAAILAGAVRAFDHRKAALENLVRLQAQGYFAGPQVPNDIGREFVRKSTERGRADARDKTAERTGRRRD